MSTFDFHENEPAGGTHFQMNGFARRLVLTQRQKATRKWPIKSFTCIALFLLQLATLKELASLVEKPRHNQTCSPLSLSLQRRVNIEDKGKFGREL